MEFGRLVFPPRSREEIAHIQSARLRIAFERARQSQHYRGRLEGIDADRLDDPREWRKIPILSKDELRDIPAEQFHERFCIRPDTDAVEYWRSGGATGRPLFYPRSAEDIAVSMEMFQRLWRSAGCTAKDKAHISFPMGIHPVGSLYARAAEMMGIGTVWAGAGSNTPSELQLDLIRTLKPTVWIGMGSYALQLAALAERQGLDLSRWTVRKILSAAEPLSAAKRAKLERLWNAEVFDQFGCTEIGGLASESDRHDGFHVWTDLVHMELVDPASGEPLPAGETGVLVMTPLWTNTMTPFLRWNMGDLGTIVEHGATTGPLGVFPVFRHAARTAGFFKVRGININHNDFEDFMHRHEAIADFRLEVAQSATLDVLKLQVELRRGATREAVEPKLLAAIKRAFEVTPTIEFLEVGTLAQLFLNDVKAKRFVDSRHPATQSGRAP